MQVEFIVTLLTTTLCTLALVLGEVLVLVYMFVFVVNTDKGIPCPQLLIKLLLGRKLLRRLIWISTIRVTLFAIRTTLTVSLQLWDTLVENGRVRLTVDRLQVFVS